MNYAAAAGESPILAEMSRQQPMYRPIAALEREEKRRGEKETQGCSARSLVKLPLYNHRLQRTTRASSLFPLHRALILTICLTVLAGSCTHCGLFAVLPVLSVTLCLSQCLTCGLVVVCGSSRILNEPRGWTLWNWSSGQLEHSLCCVSTGTHSLVDSSIILWPPMNFGYRFCCFVDDRFSCFP